MAAVAYQNNTSSAPHSEPQRRSARIPRQYLSLHQHRNSQDETILSREEVLMRYAETMERDYKVKIPKPLYAEATQARRQSMARNAKKILTYAVAPSAPAAKAGPTPAGRGVAAAIKGLASTLFNPHFIFAPPTPDRPYFGGRNPTKPELEEEYNLG